ncbi:hypothetical protein VPH35_048838 [Triticum aestivum]|uniref:Uncharacterized protein n=1 Tax=Triticum aestivum TaxID=4565 RepID=A0A172GYI3_WHEAT|nr:hypothetical protein AEX81_00002 [Triticum aestivum]
MEQKQFGFPLKCIECTMHYVPSCAWSAVTTFGPTTHGHFRDKLLHQKFAWRRSGTLGYIRPMRMVIGHIMPLDVVSDSILYCFSFNQVNWSRQRDGGHALKWEAELASPNDDGFDPKWKWEAKSKPCTAGKVETKWGAEEANEDDKKPARKCVQIKEIPIGCDIQIEVLSRKDEIVVMKYGISSTPVAK